MRLRGEKVEALFGEDPFFYYGGWLSLNQDVIGL